MNVGKWSPVKIPDAFRQYTRKDEGSDDPRDSWDASRWDDPDARTLRERLKPNHGGQWLILGAVLLFGFGAMLWMTQFVPVASGNPWTLVAVAWPASLALAWVHGNERGFSRHRNLDWAFITTGRSVEALPGKFVDKFGNGDMQHIRFKLLKSRSYGGFQFRFLKLADLEANRDRLMNKAVASNRAPDSPAYLELPGPLTGENTNTVLGRVFGTHGGAMVYHDGGADVDLRITNPSNLDDDIASQVLEQLEILDKKVVPHLESEIQTLETLKQRYKTRAEQERDPELDRMFETVDRLTALVNRPRGRSGVSDEDSDVDEIRERAREQVNGQ